MGCCVDNVSGSGGGSSSCACTWAEALSNDNPSGGTDPLITDGDSIIGETTAGATGGSIPLLSAGTSQAGGAGGAITLTTAGGTDNAAGTGGTGGALTNTLGAGGDGTALGNDGGVGGTWTVLTGAGGAGDAAGTGGAGGAMVGTTGAGGTSGSGTAGQGGGATWTTGDGGASASGTGGQGGTWSTTTGDGGTGNVGGAGGNYLITTGSGQSSSAGTGGAAGAIVQTTGNGGDATALGNNGGVGGAWSLVTGTGGDGDGAGTGGAAGTMAATLGTGGAAAAAGGGDGGAGGGATFTMGDGGAGDGAGTGGAGGSFTINLGAGGAGGTAGAAGTFNVNDGDALLTDRIAISGADFADFHAQNDDICVGTGAEVNVGMTFYSSTTSVQRISFTDVAAGPAGQAWFQYDHNANEFNWKVNGATELELNNTQFWPFAEAGLSLGTTTRRWNGVHVSTEDVIQYTTDKGLKSVDQSSGGGIILKIEGSSGQSDGGAAGSVDIHALAGNSGTSGNTAGGAGGNLRINWTGLVRTNDGGDGIGTGAGGAGGGIEEHAGYGGDGGVTNADGGDGGSILRRAGDGGDATGSGTEGAGGDYTIGAGGPGAGEGTESDYGSIYLQINDITRWYVTGENQTNGHSIGDLMPGADDSYNIGLPDTSSPLLPRHVHSWGNGYQNVGDANATWDGSRVVRILQPGAGANTLTVPNGLPQGTSLVMIIPNTSGGDVEITGAGADTFNGNATETLTNSPVLVWFYKTSATNWGYLSEASFNE